MPGKVLDKLFWINVHYACFGIVVRDDKVIHTAPIAKWLIGKKMSEVQQWINHISGTILLSQVEENPYEDVLADLRSQIDKNKEKKVIGFQLFTTPDTKKKVLEAIMDEFKGINSKPSMAKQVGDALDIPVVEVDLDEQTKGVKFYVIQEWVRPYDDTFMRTDYEPPTYRTVTEISNESTDLSNMLTQSLPLISIAF